MSDGGERRSAGRLLAECLRAQGVDTVFCVPGESFLVVLDALHDLGDEIRLVVCRHEAGAANMAEAYGKLTGRPGICMVTRGPGATHASIGVHTAFQDSTPMILFVGQVGRDALEREAFQEVDLGRMFGPLAKWAARIDDPDRVPEFVGRAFATATAGRPGPVVLALPDDMLAATTAARPAGPYRVARAAPSAADMTRLRALMADAERPFLLVGGGGWSAETGADLLAFAEANDLAVGASFRCQDYIDNRHRCYAGHVGIGIEPALAERVRSADLLIVVGARLGEMTTGGYTLVEPPRPRQRLVHVHADPEELGRVYQPDLPINAGSAAFAAMARTLAPVEPRPWAAETAAAHAAYLASLEPVVRPAVLDMAAVMQVLRRRLPADAILTNGAGNYTGWVSKYWCFTRYRTQLAPTSGAMGYGLPAAIAAKLRHPERVVVSFNGDGDFLMCCQELATAAQYGAALLVLVVNNGMYGTIRMHQEREFPGRVTGTDLHNPDFAALARAFGAYAELVEATDGFEPALDRALASGRLALLELRTDPDLITPRTTLRALRSAALARPG